MAKSGTESVLFVPRLKGDISPSDFLESAGSPSGELKFFWNGDVAPGELKTNFRVAWTPDYLYAFLECNYTALNVAAEPQTKEKTIGLWDRDVVEVFIAPDLADPNHYLEVEVSPLGEWVDVELRIQNGQRSSNWEWHSIVEAACKIDDSNVWRSAFRIPSERLFGSAIKAGQECLGNFYRCDGVEPNRNYLTWQPTMTPAPNFHVPDKFGRIKFVNDPGD